MKKGLVQIYTGEGKGKTTSAVGLAVRAIGHKLKVCYVYFHKNIGRSKCNEQYILKKIGADIFGFAKEHPLLNKKCSIERMRKECLKGLNFVYKVFEENKYDLLILDEINVSLRDGFLEEKEVVEMIKSKPVKLELVLTGRGATKTVIKCADLVSIIKKEKHPFDKGILARKGIEY